MTEVNTDQTIAHVEGSNTTDNTSSKISEDKETVANLQFVGFSGKLSPESERLVNDINSNADQREKCKWKLIDACDALNHNPSICADEKKLARSKLRISEFDCSRFATIGKNVLMRSEAFRTAADKLAEATLYAIAKADETLVKLGLESGVINSELTREDWRSWVASQQTTQEENEGSSGENGDATEEERIPFATIFTPDDISAKAAKQLNELLQKWQDDKSLSVRRPILDRYLAKRKQWEKATLRRMKLIVREYVNNVKDEHQRRSPKKSAYMTKQQQAALRKAHIDAVKIGKEDGWQRCADVLAAVYRHHYYDECVKQALGWPAPKIPAALEGLPNLTPEPWNEVRRYSSLSEWVGAPQPETHAREDMQDDARRARERKDSKSQNVGGEPAINIEDYMTPDPRVLQDPAPVQPDDDPVKVMDEKDYKPSES